MTYLRCLLLLVLFTPAASAQLLIQDGDFYPRLQVPYALMTGGEVREFRLAGGHLLQSGGVIDSLECWSGRCSGDLEGGNIRTVYSDYGGLDFTVRGRDGEPRLYIGAIGPVELTVQGSYFRQQVRTHSVDLARGTIEGWLADGGFISLDYGLAEGARKIQIEIVPSEIARFLPGDTNYDDRVDVTDLNNVRNNYGLIGDSVIGDSNQDGGVDVADLNLTRNNFGRRGYFSLGPEYEIAGSFPVPVPEPATWTLGLVLSLLTVISVRTRLFQLRPASATSNVTVGQAPQSKTKPTTQHKP